MNWIQILQFGEVLICFDIHLGLTSGIKFLLFDMELGQDSKISFQQISDTIRYRLSLKLSSFAFCFKPIHNIPDPGSFEFINSLQHFSVFITIFFYFLTFGFRFQYRISRFLKRHFRQIQVVRVQNWCNIQILGGLFVHNVMDIVEEIFQRLLCLNHINRNIINKSDWQFTKIMLVVPLG